MRAPDPCEFDLPNIVDEMLRDFADAEKLRGGPYAQRGSLLHRLGGGPGICGGRLRFRGNGRCGCPSGGGVRRLSEYAGELIMKITYHHRDVC